MYIEGLDETDNKILEIIKENARLSYSDIGKKIGISRVSVKNRMDALEDRGIIKGYHTVLDLYQAETGVKYFLDIETKPESFEKMLDIVAHESSIKEIYIVTGDCRIHAIGYATDSRNLNVYVRGLYRELKGITKLSCHTILSTVKDVHGGIKYEVRHKESEHLEERQSVNETDDKESSKGN